MGSRVMSWNINQYRGLRTAENRKDAMKETILSEIKKFLREPDDIVFLYEVPGKKGIRGLEEALGTAYTVLPPERENDARIFTVAIINKNSRWEKAGADRFSNGRDYENRYLELTDKKSGLRALAIHAPFVHEDDADSVRSFFENLERYARRYADGKLIILGDLNVREEMKDKDPIGYPGPEIVYNKIVGECGYLDEEGRLGTSNGKTGIVDHALISGKMVGNVKNITPKGDCECSDHAPLILEVDFSETQEGSVRDGGSDEK